MKGGFEVEPMTLSDALSLSPLAESLNLDLLNSPPSKCCSAFWAMGGCNVGAAAAGPLTPVKKVMSCIHKHELRQKATQVPDTSLTKGKGSCPFKS